MISFFKINASYKIIFLFLFFLILRLPALILGIPLLVPELNWMLVGERMQEGFALYTQIWDDISPLSAFIFWMIDALFGKSAWALRIISLILIFVQAMMLNHFLIKRRVFSDLSLIPGLVYIVLTVSFYDYFTLSPALMANTFLIISIRYLFLHISEKRKYDSLFEIGAYIGVATLFYLPSCLFLLVPAVSYLFFTGTKFRSYMLMIFSFGFTVGIAFLLFYIIGSEYAFYQNYIESVFYLAPIFYVRLLDLSFLFAIPGVLMLLAIRNTYGHKRYTNYQIRCQTIIFFWFVCSLFTVLLDSRISAYSLLPIFPAIAFYLTHYFLLIRQSLWKEALFVLLLVSALFFNYGSLYNLTLPIPVSITFSDVETYDVRIRTDRVVVEPHPRKDLLDGKKVLVFGNKLDNYQNAQVASPYLNWRLAQRHFQKIDQFFNIRITIYQNIFDNPEGDIPEVIVDEDGTAQKLFTLMPVAAQHYEKVVDNPAKIYVRK